MIIASGSKTSQLFYRWCVDFRYVELQFARLGTILTEEEQCNMCSCNYECATLLSLKSVKIYEAFIVRALTLNSLKTLFFFLSLYSQPSTFSDPSLIADST